MGSTYSLGYDMWSIGLLLYLLATGKNPFEKDSLRRIKSLDFAFPMLLSSPLLDLLSRLLVEEPHRLNCEQSLRIPFINR
jgi:serine/threonine protein kinase